MWRQRQSETRTLLKTYSATFRWIHNFNYRLSTNEFALGKATGGFGFHPEGGAAAATAAAAAAFFTASADCFTYEFNFFCFGVKKKKNFVEKMPVCILKPLAVSFEHNNKEKEEEENLKKLPRANTR